MAVKICLRLFTLVLFLTMFSGVKNVHALDVSGIYLYYIDAQEVIWALPHTKELKRQVETLVQNSQKQVNELRAELLEQKSQTNEKNFQELVGRFNKKLDQAQRDLEKKEQALVSPLLERISTLIEPYQSGVAIYVMLHKFPLIGWPSACDATTWLVRNIKPNGQLRERVRPFVGSSACLIETIGSINLDKVAAQSPDARDSQKKLEELRLSYQTKIDTERATLKRKQVTDTKSKNRLAQEWLLFNRKVLGYHETLRRKRVDLELSVYDSVWRKLARVRPIRVALVEDNKDIKKLKKKNININYKNYTEWALNILR